MSGVTFITTSRCRARYDAHRRTARRRRARWDMTWHAPAFADLVVRGLGYGAATGAIAGTPVLPVLGTAFGAVLGLLGALLVAPVVALVLRRDDGRAVGTALVHAEIAAVVATLLVFGGLLPPLLHIETQRNGFYALLVSATLVSAWCSARVLVVRAFRRSLRGES